MCGKVCVERVFFHVPALIYGGKECEILAVLHCPLQRGDGCESKELMVYTCKLQAVCQLGKEEKVLPMAMLSC